MRKYSMEDTTRVSKIASEDIERWLNTLDETIIVKNVEDDEYYRSKDIDILWRKFDQDGKQNTITIEIKGDRNYKTGNYFFETISNKDKNTPGCFMYTEANFLFYYFVYEKELHILPMPSTREWFIQNIDQFVEKETSTGVGENYYITVGRLVDRRILKEKVEGVHVIDLNVEMPI